MKCNNSKIDNTKLLEMIKSPAIKISVCDVTLKLHLFKSWERFNITIEDEMDLDELVELLYEARRDEGSDDSAEDYGAPATEQKSIETECAPDNCKPPLVVKPSYIFYEAKMRELLGAVERNIEHMKTCCMTSKEMRGQLHRISALLKEAIIHTELMDELDED
jgi:hypothetical protein